ncbi:glycoside hydrolase family 43 protein [Streptomyces atroolivaceus]|uniref:Family 43 glycosylhydrolase n=1 Tax=Streptomyces atroolivaceus TaxID=66869 RepID=A0ABV9VHH4_STRAZ|nr:glycoside hydrolase family 43 protein [Streptomyces atroolivaceus]
MSTELFNPLVPGFNPDPSVVRVGEDYYLVTSSFEYLPGLPVYHSTDFESWEQIGNVATRAEQLEIYDVPTPFGVFAPTIRHHDGLFHVIVTVVGGRGCLIFTAADPAGEWSDGTVIEGLQGIDPDLAWDEHGNAYVTYCGSSEANGETRPSILQVQVDVASGTVLEGPRPLWSGTGLKNPEAPHLYQRGGFWYLLIAEGGTERGHAVSIARSTSPEGPFEGSPSNPFLSARSTDRPIQNTGHGDIVELPDGSTGMVLLGMRPVGLMPAFSPLGRETFATRLEWVDGWPVAEPVTPNARQETIEFHDAFTAESFDNGWVAVRRTPSEVASVKNGDLVLVADGEGLDDPHPTFLGRRQTGLTAKVSVETDVSRGTGGLSLRFDEHHHYDLEARSTPQGVRLLARARLAGIQQEWHADLPAGPIILHVTAMPNAGQGSLAEPVEHVTFTAAPVGDESAAVTVAVIDGRYLSAEAVLSFTGRVLGLYCTEGAVTFRGFSSVSTNA